MAWTKCGVISAASRPNANARASSGSRGLTAHCEGEEVNICRAVQPRAWARGSTFCNPPAMETWKPVRRMALRLPGRRGLPLIPEAALVFGHAAREGGLLIGVPYEHPQPQGDYGGEEHRGQPEP